MVRLKSTRPRRKVCAFLWMEIYIFFGVYFIGLKCSIVSIIGEESGSAASSAKDEDSEGESDVDGK